MARRVRRQPADAHRVLSDHGSPRDVGSLLETLVAHDAGDAIPLPEALAERYGGVLAFAPKRPYVVANFVSTLDGIVSFAQPGRESAAVVSGGDEGDRFVLALLRACADAIVVGAGTLRAERTHLWTPEFVYPDARADFAALRRTMGRPPHATVVFVTASGEVDRDAPIFHSGVPVRVLTGRLGSRDIWAAAGGGLIVTEGGPTLFGQLLRERAVDELFLTLAPRVAGRSGDVARRALVEGQAFAPEDAPNCALVSLKRHDDFLLARYRFR